MIEIFDFDAAALTILEAALVPEAMAPEIDAWRLTLIYDFGDGSRTLVTALDNVVPCHYLNAAAVVGLTITSDDDDDCAYSLAMDHE